MTSPHVLIIGAGLGGLTLAQALRKKGLSFEIFEREAEMEGGSQGWAISVHSIINDLNISTPEDLPPIEGLDQLASLGLSTQLVFYTQVGSGSPVQLRRTELANGRDIIRVDRGRLRNWLATNIPIQFNKRAIRIDNTQGKVTVHFEDGSSATGDIVVGADGAQSHVRKHILSHQNKPDPLRTEPLVALTMDVILHGDDVDEQMALATSAYITAFRDSKGSAMRGFVGLVDASVSGKEGQGEEKAMRYCANMMYRDFDVPSQGDRHWSRKATGEMLLAEAKQRARNLPAQFRALVDRTRPEGITVPPLRLYTLLMDVLPASRLTLLGDAAHTMPPFRGQGGVHAMMDALNLSRAIGNIAEEKDMEKRLEKTVRVLDEYQREMLARGGKAAEESSNSFDADFKGMN